LIDKPEDLVFIAEYDLLAEGGPQLVSRDWVIKCAKEKVAIPIHDYKLEKKIVTEGQYGVITQGAIRTPVSASPPTTQVPLPETRQEEERTVVIRQPVVQDLDPENGSSSSNQVQTVVEPADPSVSDTHLTVTAS
jgi:hypothetical protein